MIIKIDAHQHFWQYNQPDFGWINEKMAKIKRSFLPSELEQELSRFGFNGSIAVQARQSLEETRWLLQLADDSLYIKGVVGWVDLCSQEIENQLKEFSKHPKFVGVRHVVQDEPDDDFMSRPNFQHGISLLENYGLTFDLLLFPKHLPAAVELVRKFPFQKFVLDHIAKPLIAEQVLSPWQEDIYKLASCPNVLCKLSGMVTEADWSKHNQETFDPYLEVVYKAFGPERLMIGSDWPVCTLAGSYQEVMKIVINFISKLPQIEQDQILGLNCARFYGIR
jgi:L-fuconolactonase